MKASIAEAVLRRAGDTCECGCGRPFDGSVGGRATLDHFFGRARSTESVETVLVLREDCHRDKTDNRPNARTWHLLFIAHCRKHNYTEAAERARRRLEGMVAVREAEARRC